MSDEAAGPEATQGKSPSSSSAPSYHARFNEAVEGWKAICCQKFEKHKRCGAPPHKTRMERPNEDGSVTLKIDCHAGHEGVWTFDITADEMKAEVERIREAQEKVSAEAQAGDGTPQVARDPLKASVKISMDLRTQAITIDKWVPTPGIGLQLAAILTCHFSAAFQQSAGPLPGALALPAEKKIVDPKTGKPVVLN